MTSMKTVLAFIATCSHSYYIVIQYKSKDMSTHLSHIRPVFDIITRHHWKFYRNIVLIPQNPFYDTRTCHDMYAGLAYDAGLILSYPQ